MSNHATITDLLRQVSEGEDRIFENGPVPESENRYLAVRQNSEYFPSPECNFNLPIEKLPWSGSRNKPRVPLDAIQNIKISFDANSDKMVDFYETGSHAFLLSNRLASLIDKLDPCSLELRKIEIEAKDGEVDFNMAMPVRNLEAIDVSRTDIIIKNENYAGENVRQIQFPNGVIFDQGKINGALSFSEIDVRGWFWSRDLIAAAKDAGIKGLYTTLPGTISSVAVDRL